MPEEGKGVNEKIDCYKCHRGLVCTGQEGIRLRPKKTSWFNYCMECEKLMKSNDLISREDVIRILRELRSEVVGYGLARAIEEIQSIPEVRNGFKYEGRI